MPDLDLAADAAAGHHLLIVSGEVTRSDIEALAASTFPQLYPHDEFSFAVSETLSISGPYALSDDVRAQLGIPAWAEIAFVAHVPADRGAALPEELAGIDPVWDALADGLPQGEEARALEFLRAAARRLGGALVVAGGVVLDPAESPDLTVYSPIWLDPATLDSRLVGIFSEHRSSLDDADTYKLPEDVVLDAYSIYSPVPGGIVSVEVYAAEFLPPSIAGFAWAAEGCVAYAVRFAPEDETSRQRADVARIIEQACRAILDVAPGVIADVDGFLLELDER